MSLNELRITGFPSRIGKEKLAEVLAAKYPNQNWDNFISSMRSRKNPRNFRESQPESQGTNVSSTTPQDSTNSIGWYDTHSHTTEVLQLPIHFFLPLSYVGGYLKSIEVAL